MTVDNEYFVWQYDVELIYCLVITGSLFSIFTVGGRILYDIKEAGTIRESKDTCLEDWIDVATEIANNYNDYDGFVILHGTDTMAYTASALSFMFENLGKPIVLTGAQVSI